MNGSEIKLRTEDVPTLVAQAAEQRMVSEYHAAELVVTVSALARMICKELAALGHRGPFRVIPSLTARTGPTCTRVYEIQDVTWGLWRRGRGPVLLARYPRNHLLFDPSHPDGAWDPMSPPAPRLRGLPGSWPLADAEALAQFAHDARHLLDNLIRDETATAKRIEQGVAAADAALDLLPLGR